MTNINGTLVITVTGPPPAGTYRMILTPPDLQISPGTTATVDLAVEYPDGTIGPPTPGAAIQAFWQTAPTGLTFSVTPTRVTISATRQAPPQVVHLDLHLSAV